MIMVWIGKVLYLLMTTMTVEELTEMLTDPQKDALREQLIALDLHSFSQRDILRQYTIAKSCV